MKAVVVGFGSIGKRHVNNLLSISDLEILICTKKKRIDLINKKRCKTFDSLKDSLKEKPHIGLVTNVSNLHVETAIKLANAGCHLFIEKPLSDSMNKVDVLLNIVKKKKLVTLMGCNLRFHGCIRKIKEILSNNEIGKIISVHAECGTYLPDWHPYEDYRDSYASRKDLGGGVVLTCIHEIDYLYWFFGDAKEAFSMSGKHSDLKISVDDLSSILLRFKNNIIAEIHLDYFQRPQFRSCKIIGTKGTIYWDSNTNEVKVYDVKKKKWIQKLKLHYDHNAMYVDEISHFLKCINKKEKSINDISQGIKTLKIALAIMRASKIKKIVTL